MSAPVKAPPSLTRHVDELWEGVNARPALLEAAEAVERLADTPGLQAIWAVLNREIATIDRQLEGPVDPSECIRLLGRKSGLAAIDGAISAIRERATKRRAEGEAEARANAAGESATER